MAAAADPSPSPPPPPPPPPHNDGSYDVFLSFRGLDTRRTFTPHLYHALKRKGLHVFIDNEQLAKGDVLGVLLKSIEASKLSVVVLSENFANSKWCLMELQKIMECRETKKQIVIPIFYQVNVADVRHVRGRFKEAFEDHEHKCTGTIEERKRWRSALTRASGIHGWNSSNSK